MLRTRIASIAALFAFLWSLAAPAATPIKIAELNWAGSSAAAYVLEAVMEEYLDADVEVVGGDEIALFEAMAKGDGAIDVFSDFWSIYLPAQWERYVVPGIVKINAKPYLGTEGLFIPGYTQDELGLTRIEQLADPEMAKHFDTDGDGKGEMWTGVAGWQSVNEWAVKAKSMGFADYWTPTTVETWVMESQLDAAYKRQKPFMFYSYQPEWIHAAYDLRQIEERPSTASPTSPSRTIRATTPRAATTSSRRARIPTGWRTAASPARRRPPTSTSRTPPTSASARPPSRSSSTRSPSRCRR